MATLILLALAALLILGCHRSCGRWPGRRGRAREGAAMSEMRDLSQRLEERMRTLESILDDQAPAWRRRYDV